jgi:hypothetical protein
MLDKGHKIYFWGAETSLKKYYRASGDRRDDGGGSG